ncbi:hypothetical protein BAUCODRAFT_151616 [Baudoinia panamericana UAMH 10762]|uniref:GAT domain-containing protein n=1 Tax=Baudoinia panamericana (strain UAMH 10762) TaxID=717646 RepID=M2N0N4_BAUPA|nr:uncharacterized protein BAUCODRAFT_151616 [Baudoinia panamericana UAMH 10762]EMC92185.1 hypothetical protein BAUCODRAFT_151616 [Baudoinia panamericana UAMH 10762]
MKRFSTLLRHKSNDNATRYDLATAPADSPEANAGRAIRLFCESGSTSNGGEEVLHLPVIVEAAESSPAAAAVSAHQIRTFLSRDWVAKPHVQYNAMMLIRILSDNPGRTFTRNFDKQFVSTVKELLRNGRDPNTQQMLRETLDNLEVSKAHDEGLQLLLQMWRKEKGQTASLAHSRSVRGPPLGPTNGTGFWPRSQSTPQQQPPMQPQPVSASDGQQHAAASRRHQLPPPVELAGRIEEARNTAKILMQLLQSTPPSEVPPNELIKEFSERCQTAQKSMQAYVHCNDPPPDDDTMLTLIETTEHLSLATSRYQRALLAARRSGSSPQPEVMQNGYGAYSDPSPPMQNQAASTPSPPPQQRAPQHGNSLFAPAPQHRYPADGYGSYQSPPGPPPNRLSTPQPHGGSSDYAAPQRMPMPSQSPPPRGPVTVPFSDPFADPAEYHDNPAPLAFEPTNYGSVRHSNISHARTSRAFSIDSENAYGTAGGGPSASRHSTLDYNNRPSPDLSARTPSIGTTPTSPEFSATLTPPQQHSHPVALRPGPGPYHYSGATPSYLGRQSSAADGLTMHGAGGPVDEDNGVAVQEIDSHSDVGRRDRDRATTEASPSDAGTTVSSLETMSPVEFQTAQTARRVDIRGTGGFRNSITGVRV